MTDSTHLAPKWSFRKASDRRSALTFGSTSLGAASRCAIILVSFDGPWARTVLDAISNSLCLSTPTLRLQREAFGL